MELELLGVRESVELLSAVAQLDTSEVSPRMIEIVSQQKSSFLSKLRPQHGDSSPHGYATATYPYANSAKTETCVTFLDYFGLQQVTGTSA